MKPLVDTRAVSPDQSFEYYRDMLCAHVGQFLLKRDGDEAGPFSARLRGAAFGQLSLTHGTGDAHSIGQDRACAANNPYSFSLMLPRAGCTAIQTLEGGKEARVAPPGSILVSDTNATGWVRMHRCMDVYFVHVPPQALGHSLGDSLREGSLVLRPDHGLVDLLAAFIARLPAALEDADADSQDQLADQLVGLAVLALREAGEDAEAGLSGTDMATVQFDSARRVIAARLQESDLAPAHVAAVMNVSERQLFRIFASQGTSFREEMRRQRLTSAARDLVDPVLAEVSVSDIALRNGFSNFSHFSRAFREAHGLPPSVYRQKSERR